jgi:hypothetical protein
MIGNATLAELPLEQNMITKPYVIVSLFIFFVSEYKCKGYMRMKPIKKYGMKYNTQSHLLE